MKGTDPVSREALAVWNSTNVTAVTVTTTDESTIAFVGTENGFIKKVITKQHNSTTNCSYRNSTVICGFLWRETQIKDWIGSCRFCKVYSVYVAALFKGGAQLGKWAMSFWSILSLCLSAFLAVCVFVCLRLSVSVPTLMPVCVFCLSVHVSVSVFVCLCLCLCVFVSVCVFVRLCLCMYFSEWVLEWWVVLNLLSAGHSLSVCLCLFLWEREKRTLNT